MRDARADVVVVGGGLAGLTAANLLSRAGRRVTLVERSHAIGGRAATASEDGFHLNLGPHAWYVGGPGTAILEGLGVRLSGNRPKPAANFAIAEGRIHAMPIGFVSLLTTDLLGIHGKFEAARALASIARTDPSAHDHITVETWLQTISDRRARQVVGMLMRIAAYTEAPQLLSAGTALYALHTVIRKGVRYLHGGWASIVEQLSTRARSHGVEIVTSSSAAAVLHDGLRALGVRLDDGTVLRGTQVVLAVDPAVVRRLTADLPGSGLWNLVPSRAAVLDLALDAYPNPKVIAAFGADRPLYFAVHSASADLAPANGAVVHAAKYLDPDVETDPREDERELEELMDMLQPGWRAHVRARRYLPRMVVTHAIPTAAGGGFRSRPAVDALGVSGVYLAGDWVGGEGTLANAAVASAARAAERILTHEAREAVAS
jgi:phytoene dehydrogenase-like protein